MCVCMCALLYFGQEGNVRAVLGGGHVGGRGEEEDIIGDFPPRLHYFKHTHLVFLRSFHTKLALCVTKLPRKRDQTWERV